MCLSASLRTFRLLSPATLTPTFSTLAMACEQQTTQSVSNGQNEHADVLISVFLSAHKVCI